MHERARVVVVDGEVDVTTAAGEAVSAGPGHLFEFDPAERHTIAAQVRRSPAPDPHALAGRRPPRRDDAGAEGRSTRARRPAAPGLTGRVGVSTGLKHVDPSRPPGLFSRALCRPRQHPPRPVPVGPRRLEARPLADAGDPWPPRHGAGHAHRPARDAGGEERRAAAQRGHLLPRRRPGHDRRLEARPCPTTRPGFTTSRPTPRSASAASRCGRPWSATRPSAGGSGCSPTVSSPPTRTTAAKRRRRTGRSRSSSSPPREAEAPGPRAFSPYRARRRPWPSPRRRGAVPSCRCRRSPPWPAGGCRCSGRS